MSDEELKEQWDSIENSNITKACEYLRGYEQEIGEHLARFVASLCDISVEEMLSDRKNNYFSQARWLYWYALRYMTDDTYEKIAIRTIYNGKKFTLRAVAKGIEKMSEMIDNDGIWRKRWVILKRIIKMHNSNDSDNTITILVTKPSGVKVNVEFKNE